MPLAGVKTPILLESQVAADPVGGGDLRPAGHAAALGERGKASRLSERKPWWL